MKLTMTQFKKYRAYIGGKKNIRMFDGGRGVFACALSYEIGNLEQKLIKQREAKAYWDSLSDNDRVELFHKMVSA